MNPQTNPSHRLFYIIQALSTECKGLTVVGDKLRSLLKENIIALSIILCRWSVPARCPNPRTPHNTFPKPSCLWTAYLLSSYSFRPVFSPSFLFPTLLHAPRTYFVRSADCGERGQWQGRFCCYCLCNFSVAVSALLGSNVATASAKLCSRRDSTHHPVSSLARKVNGSLLAPWK